MMARRSSPPKIEPDSMGGEKHSHPSYAVVAFHRCSGNIDLFDSSIQHRYFIEMVISTATKRVDGHHTSIFADKQLVAVRMSETQFARAITAMNMGSGSPCTLSRFNGESFDEPEREDNRGRHKELIQDRLKGALAGNEALAAKIREWREAKHRPTMKEMDELIGGLERSSQHFESNMSHYARGFTEHMEEVVDEAKADIECHLLSSANRLSVTAPKLPAIESDDSIGKVGMRSDGRYSDSYDPNNP